MLQNNRFRSSWQWTERKAVRNFVQQFWDSVEKSGTDEWKCGHYIIFETSSSSNFDFWCAQFKNDNGVVMDRFWFTKRPDSTLFQNMGKLDKHRRDNLHSSLPKNSSKHINLWRPIEANPD